MYSKIIARDLRLVASRLYRMAVTQPGVTCRRYILQELRIDLNCIFGGRLRTRTHHGDVIDVQNDENAIPTDMEVRIGLRKREPEEEEEVVDLLCQSRGDCLRPWRGFLSFSLIGDAYVCMSSWPSGQRLGSTI